MTAVRDEEQTEQGADGSTGAASGAEVPVVDFATSPDRYRHWTLEIDGEVATVTLTVDEAGGLVPGYELKMNSYDLGVDIELYDLTQRLRFEHPEVKAVVMTGGLERMFCAGANIRMLARSSHTWKVNFCKFTNETRNGIEDATAHGQTWIAALNGTAAGGGYEMALACEEIILLDDGSSTVSLPEVPLLGVLPGTGGLTRVVDKRHVRKDRADLFATKSEGYRGETAVEWGLVDATYPMREWEERVAGHAAAAVARSTRSGERGVELIPLEVSVEDGTIRYPYLEARTSETGRSVDITVVGPDQAAPQDAAAALAQGVDYWPMALARALDDLVLRLRTNEPDLGTWVFRTRGESDLVLGYDEQLRDGGHWYLEEVRAYLARVLKRLDVTSRSLISVIEPGSCLVGVLLEVSLACDRQYMLDGVYEDVDPDATPAALTLTASNDGTYPMGNGLSRLASRFWGQEDQLESARQHLGEPVEAVAAEEVGLVTMALDDIDFEDELRIVLEERASLSPDALTGMEANHRFVGPETVETKIFGRLTAWQNWIFNRPNASGPDGALRRYGSGQRGSYDHRRV
ncbi:enoyl-CoA hydratase [Marmoricola endophyticus]|uniref:Enoyl-CoA hydratase n=1 Tax=Marmoricola endophyticus TaxID=2040280 RepID=A0A917BSF4_9ACTN|nr:2,3-epoxybenzoyl-CoA dihydrolase [Marmoricola endophyticus]GGF57236.1 enoyl-CoA hydratase [Marmoricola endophyticus]